MTELFEPTIDELILCAEREVTKRQSVYPRLVAAGQMGQIFADKQLWLMKGIVSKLKALK